MFWKQRLKEHTKKEVNNLAKKINKMEIKIASTDDEILKCYDVLKVLRPHLEFDSFVPIVKEMITEGYQLAFIEESRNAVAAIGFRYLQFLYNGKHYYIDDLCTLPEARGKGYGGMLLDYVIELARKNGYKTVTLDSGYVRHDAHRLYLNKDFTLNCHHFLKAIE